MQAEQLLISDPQACGVGEGARCCAFLIAGGQGFECARVFPGLVETLRERIELGSINARYDPGDPEDVPFPQCQEKR